MAHANGSQFDLDASVARGGAIGLDAVPWSDVARHPVMPDVVCTLTCTHDGESRHVFFYDGPNGRNGGWNGYGPH